MTSLFSHHLSDFLPLLAVDPLQFCSMDCLFMCITDRDSYYYYHSTTLLPLSRTCIGVSVTWILGRSNVSIGTHATDRQTQQHRVFFLEGVSNYFAVNCSLKLTCCLFVRSSGCDVTCCSC